MYKRAWTKELERKAKEELNETSKNREECLNCIKDWISKDPYLNARTEDEWILNFLRGCKFDVEKTKEKIVYLNNTKSAIPEFYSNRDPLLPELQEILDRCIFIPQSTEHEELIIVRWKNTSKLSLNNVLKLAFMLLDYVIMQNSTFLVLGYHIIIDLEGFSMSHIRQLSPVILKNLCCTVLHAYPARIKGIYFCNVFPLFPTLFKMVSMFFNKKMLGRIKMFDSFNLKELSKYISVADLPKEYGGNSDSIFDIADRCKKILEDNREWFRDDEKYKTKNPQSMR